MSPRPFPCVALLATCLLFRGTVSFAAPAPTVEMSATASEFLAENAAAMDRMMSAMDVAPTGDVDRDFVAMMVPHHQGAIDMAMLVLRYGKSEPIRRLAQEIIVTQQQEIAAMYLAIGVPLPKPAPLEPAAATPHHHHHRPARP